MIKLTEHFSLAELTASEMASRHDWDNTPTALEIANLVRLATLLEAVRRRIGKPILINSGYRSKKLNDAIGSKDTSQHRLGCAADIRVSNMTPDEVCNAIIDSDIAYDQLIREFYDPSSKTGGWTHISVPNANGIPPRKQALIIDRSGTRPFE